MFSKDKTDKRPALNGPASSDALVKPGKKEASVKKESAIKNATPTTPPSIISTNMVITGDLDCDGEIQVDGKVHGDVRCDKLTIGQQGEIEGSIVAERALLRGKISGRIEAKSVTLMSTATVIGDIVHEALTIEPGAYMEGHCKRLEPSAQRAGNSSSSPAKMDLVVNEGELSTA